MNTFKLSILIPHTTKYVGFLERLERVLNPQLTPDVQVIKYVDNGEKTIGKKRNWLLQKATGKYLCFIDSDDVVSENYVSLLMEGIEKNVDACSLTGIITEDGGNPKRFIHSMKYASWFEADGVYYRNNNHLNCIKSDIAKRMVFPETNHGEDRDYSKQLLNSGMIRTEHWIEPVIYYYEYRRKK